MAVDETAAWVQAATDRVITTMASIDEEKLRAPSALPGWSRAHVLTHLARNADAQRNLLLAGRSGERVWMYPSAEARAADIDAGATRPLDVIVADVIAASSRFAIEVRAMPADAWGHTVEITHGAGVRQVPASRAVEMRLREVELHHLDLGMGYDFTFTPTATLVFLLADTATRLTPVVAFPFEVRATDLKDQWIVGQDAGTVDGADAIETVSGPAADLMAWLSHRADGSGLTTSSGAALPDIPSLG